MDSGSWLSTLTGSDAASSEVASGSRNFLAVNVVFPEHLLISSYCTEPGIPIARATAKAESNWMLWPPPFAKGRNGAGSSSFHTVLKLGLPRDSVTKLWKETHADILQDPLLVVPLLLLWSGSRGVELRANLEL